MISEKRIVTGSIIGFIITLGLSIYVSDTIISTNIIFLGVLILFIPYSIFKFLEFKKVKAYEESFPNFLRDLAESQRAGLPILQSIKLASKSDYGILSHEIKKMESQLSWNVPLETVLNNFSKKMKKSVVIARTILIIQQANKSGGNVEDTMDSLADNIEMLKSVKEEKEILLSQQVMMMYGIFFIFLGISIALLKFLIPLLQSDISDTSSFSLFSANSNPCFECLSTNTNPQCTSCDLFFTVSDSAGLGEREEASTYYKSVFFVMIIVQAIFSGLIAGQIGSGSAAAGIKHSMIMLLSGGSIFLLVSKLGII